MKLDDELIDDIKEWRKVNLSLCSQYVHPSYVAAFLSAEPPSILSPYYHSPGILGKTSILSMYTISEVCKAIWYFSRIVIEILMQFAKQKGEGSPEWKVFQGENGAAVIVGREIYSKLILRYWEYGPPDIFAEDDK